jgi:MFS family permease
MDLRLATVTTLWAASQVANALTLYLWGRLSDRLSNKAILAIALPAYFGCLVALPFTALPEIHALTLPLLALIHLVLGAASGGIGLATGNLGLKLAPQGRGTAYLATVSVAGALAGGIAAILGGALAEWFASRQLELLLHWSSPSAHNALTVVNFQHWEFLFALAFALGGYVLHALSRIDEGPEISERAAMQQLVFEARSAVLVPFGRLFERRLRPRRATPAAATPMPGAASQGGGRGPPGPAA